MHVFKNAILPEFKNCQNNCKKTVCLEMLQLIEVIRGSRGCQRIGKKVWHFLRISLLIKFEIGSYP